MRAGGVLDAHLARIVADLSETGVAERRPVLEVLHVVLHGDADLEDFRVTENREKPRDAAAVVEPEKVYGVLAASCTSEEIVSAAGLKFGFSVSKPSTRSLESAVTAGATSSWSLDDDNAPLPLAERQRRDGVFFDTNGRAGLRGRLGRLVGLRLLGGLRHGERGAFQEGQAR